MTHKYFSTLLAIVFSCSLWTSAEAQEIWNLEKCVRHAQENSLSIKLTDNNLRFAEINQQQAIQARYPSLSGNTGAQVNFGRTIDPTRNEFITETFISNTFSLNSGIVLFNAGNINNSIKQSKLDVSAAHEDKKQEMADIALSVANAYLAILLAQEELEIANFQKALTQEQLDQIDKFVAAGSRPENDRLDFLAQLATSEQSIITAENNLALSFLNLKQLLRLDPTYDLQVVVPTLEIPVDNDPDKVEFTSLYSEAVRTRPNIRAGEFRLQSAHYNEKISESLLYPRITLGGSIGTNYSNRGIRFAGTEERESDPIEFIIDGTSVTVVQVGEVPFFEDSPYTNQLEDNLSYGFGLNVSIPIYNNYANQASVERARVSTLNTINANEQLRETLKNTIQTVIAQARTAKKAFEISNRSLEAQQAAFDNTEKKFNLGAASSFEYINAKNLLDSSKINRLVSKYDYIFKLKVLEYYQGKTIKLD